MIILVEKMNCIISFYNELSVVYMFLRDIYIYIYIYIYI